MSHSHSPAMPFQGHNALWRAVKIIFLAAISIVAIYEHSPALLATLAAVAVLILAMSERVRKLDGHPSAHQPIPAARLFGDGGSFPSDAPEAESPVSRPASVLDGGSLEHHRR